MVQVIRGKTTEYISVSMISVVCCTAVYIHGTKSFGTFGNFSMKVLVVT